MKLYHGTGSNTRSNLTVKIAGEVGETGFIAEKIHSPAL